MIGFQSSIAKKVVMALTGLVMVGYVIVHMLGNLTVYGGPALINEYALKLRALPALLWVARGVMLTAFVLHAFTGVWLYLDNRAARGIRYVRKVNQKADVTGTTMIWTGLLLGGFVVYHLLHFTFRVTNPDISHAVDSAGRHDVFSMIYLSFVRLGITVIYAAAMGVLLLHLFHGIGSMFQSVGANNEATLPLVERGGRWLAALLVLGFISVPLTIFLGLYAL